MSMGEATFCGKFLGNSHQSEQGIHVWVCTQMIHVMLVFLRTNHTEVVGLTEDKPALMRCFLQWLQRECQDPTGGYHSPTNTTCMDMRAVSEHLLSHWLYLASHANHGAAVDALQSYTVLSFSTTVPANKKAKVYYCVM